ncbi:MAG: ABC transporter ATP-binding protein [Candidatus Bathyarchaeia archaeon]
MNKTALLEVKNLYLHYITKKGIVRAVDNVSFTINMGETLAIVGESGCGKSSLARALMRLLPKNVYIFKGEVIMNGTNIMELDESEFRKSIRWKKISMVFQSAMDSLNPVIKVGLQVAEPLIYHEKVSKEEALKRAVELLKLVGIPEALADRYPFELSGGMQQRALIAMSLITNPDLVILDEPTSALDIMTQANIMNLLKRLQLELGLSYIFITHDVALSTELADKVGVMYAGQIVELSGADEFFTEPIHPYARMLMASAPTLRGEKKLAFIPGAPPSLINPPSGCRFNPRCPYVTDKCRVEEPPEIEVDSGHYVKCWISY